MPRTWMVPSSMPAASIFPSLLYVQVVTPTREAEGWVGRTTVFCRMWLVSQILQAEGRYQQQHLKHHCCACFLASPPPRKQASKRAVSSTRQPAGFSCLSDSSRNQQCSATHLTAGEARSMTHEATSNAPPLTAQCRPLSSSQP
jgi:hypothetical protein